MLFSWDAGYRNDPVRGAPRDRTGYCLTVCLRFAYRQLAGLSAQRLTGRRMIPMFPLLINQLRSGAEVESTHNHDFIINQNTL
jgi:hypothetical protein